jgi:hypothetical protein
MCRIFCRAGIAPPCNSSDKKGEGGFSAGLHRRDGMIRSMKIKKIDRSQYRTRKLSLAEEGRGSDVVHLSPSDRVAMVWPLTVQAWTFKEGKWDELRLRQDVVCPQRNRG